MFVYSTANYFDSLYIYLKAYTHTTAFLKTMLTKTFMTKIVSTRIKSAEYFLTENIIIVCFDFLKVPLTE